MAHFINFGMGRMHPLTHSSVHQSVTRGSTLTECAQSCLDQTQFDCLSFDYVFEGVDSICYLSKYIAANVGGLVIDVSQVQHNHYERIGKSYGCVCVCVCVCMCVRGMCVYIFECFMKNR